MRRSRFVADMNSLLFVGMVVAITAIMQGCGSSASTDKAKPAPASIAGDMPAEVRAFPVYFQEDEGTFRDTVTDSIVPESQALQSLQNVNAEQPSNDSRVHVWWTKLRIPFWNWRHGWHWYYAAYDTGHQFPTWQLNNRGHVNVCKYQTWDELRADEADRSSRRAFYDGHFTIYRSGGSWCAYYYVSKDNDTGFKGPKIDSCISVSTARSAAALSALIISAGQFWNGIKPALEPIMQDLQSVAGAI